MRKNKGHQEMPHNIPPEMPDIPDMPEEMPEEIHGETEQENPGQEDSEVNVGHFDEDRE
ncbi:MAG: hypothetical protein LUG18_15065 [Candidatus Azobacteroides sp.]|nr:hypothetical protein [Candidatus Azobacteroides sp.]